MLPKDPRFSLRHHFMFGGASVAQDGARHHHRLPGHGPVVEQHSTAGPPGGASVAQNGSAALRYAPRARLHVQSGQPRAR
jgi:hypothetical protein